MVCSDGIFIPLDDHIDVYCTTLDYPQCLQYTLHSQSHPELVRQTAQEYENRRKFNRHPSVHKVTLVKLIETGDIVSHFSTVAQTLDLSQGGMRINIDKPLADDSLIKFSFDDTVPEILRDGTGQVQWCNKQIDEAGYQAGIAFQEDQIIQSMGLYLGLQSKTIL